MGHMMKTIYSLSPPGAYCILHLFEDPISLHLAKPSFIIMSLINESHDSLPCMASGQPFH